MRNETKNTENRNPPTPPSRINLVKKGIKIGAIVLGIFLWGNDFIWLFIGLYLWGNIIRSIISCLVSFVALIGFFYFLFTHIF